MSHERPSDLELGLYLLELFMKSAEMQVRSDVEVSLFQEQRLQVFPVAHLSGVDATAGEVFFGGIPDPGPQLVHDDVFPVGFAAAGDFPTNHL
ncbi:hypothetical protein ACR30Z_18885 (plasmid) [Paenarthrobacter sp. FR1]